MKIIEHRIAVESYGGRKKDRLSPDGWVAVVWFRAVCSCGWRGRGFESRSRARAHSHAGGLKPEFGSQLGFEESA